MATEPARALVVRGTDWSETSRIVTLFTREHGKIRALAKGGRRLKSNFETALDLLNVCQILFIRKAHAGLDLLTEARVEERFPALRTDLSRLYDGYYIAELLADGSQDYDPHPALFDAALATLRDLGTTPDRRFDMLGMFELVWLRELGYRPRLEACAGCERTIPDTVVAGLGYSPTAGGVICPDCRSGIRDWRPLTAAARVGLRGLDDQHPHPELPGEARREVRQVLGYAVSTVLGRRPRLLSYVEAGFRGGG